MQTNDYLNGLVRTEDEKRLLARIQDLFARAARGTVQSDFLDLRQQDLAQAAAVNETGAVWHFDGGFEEAERKRLVVYPEWQLQPDARISCLCIRHKEFKELSLGHRDYLGAILNQGIKRERLGDIVVQSPAAFIFLDLELADYLCQQLTRVRHSNVWLEPIELTDFIYLAPETKKLQRSLASLRLDAAVAAAFNLSRTEVDLYISSGHVKLNQREVTKAATPVKAGDLVSVRGQGRFRLESVSGMSRKGRYQVEISCW